MFTPKEQGQCVPGTQMTSVFEVTQPPKTRPKFESIQGSSKGSIWGTLFGGNFPDVFFLFARTCCGRHAKEDIGSWICHSDIPGTLWWPLYWLEIRPCFGGVGPFKNRGHLGYIYIYRYIRYMYIYICIYIRVASMGFRDRMDPGQERAIMSRLEINASNVVGRQGRRFSRKLFFDGFQFF